MQELDLRKSPPREVAGRILEHYGELQPGDEITVMSPTYSAGLRMGLIEAGAQHWSKQLESSVWRLVVHRRSPSLSDLPGLHHVVTGERGDVWTCQRGRRAARIDGTARTVITTRDVATAASHLALDEPRNRLFIGDAGGNALLCLRASDLEPLSRWDVPGAPQLPLVTDDGIACITGTRSGMLGIVWPKASGEFRSALVQVGSGPHDPIVTPDGRSLMVPCSGDGVVVRVNLADGAVTGRFPVGDGPAHLALHPDGTRIYVANTFDGTLACISPEGDLLGRVESGQWAHVPEVTPDGLRIYVANFFDNTLAVFDAATLERVGTCDTDTYPHGLDISPNGKVVVATGFDGNTIRLFDAATGAQRARVEVGEGSTHTAFLPDNRTAVVACAISDHLAVLDIEAGQLAGTITLN